MYEIRWYKKRSPGFSWGQQPAFELAIGSYDARRKPLPLLTVESIESFLSVPVETTASSRVKGKPKLTQAC
eukprot:982676-Pleurochrysis_carterae.AAC.1